MCDLTPSLQVGCKCDSFFLSLTVSLQVLVDVYTDWLLFFETLMALREMQGGTEEPLAAARAHMLELFDDLDALLESDVNFMLGPQLREATRAHGPGSEVQFRNILTLWG
jgi:hypothetical protein